MKYIPNEINELLSFPLTFSMYRYFIVGYLLGKLYFMRKMLDKKVVISKFGGVANIFNKCIYPISVIVLVVFSVGNLVQL